jgi:organic radical activating enzyme
MWLTLQKLLDYRESQDFRERFLAFVGGNPHQKFFEHLIQLVTNAIG